MLLLEAPQRSECFGYTIEATLISGDEVERVAILGRCCCEAFCRGEGFVMALALAEITDAADLEFDGRG